MLCCMFVRWRVDCTATAGVYTVRCYESACPHTCSDAATAGPYTVRLSNGESYEADVVISAVGVEPSVEWVGEGVERGEDGGLLVGGDMRTSADGVYAAGDACTVRAGTHGPQWFQMRLWTQVR